jgi:hypothetical protein
VEEEFEFTDPAYDNGEEKRSSPYIDISAPATRTTSKTILGSSYQEYEACPKKSAFIFSKEPKLPPSPFALEVFESGKEYEHALMLEDNQHIISNLLQNQFSLSQPPSFLNLEDHFQETKSREDKLEQSQNILRMCLSQPSTPYVVYQINLVAETKDGTSRQGDADLALWTGEAWHLGEIKVSTAPKLSACHQLQNYQLIWKEWAPQGDKVSNTAFILHCCPGLEFHKHSDDARKEKSLQATKLLTVTLNTYQESFQKIDAALKLNLEKPKPEEHPVSFHSDCIECSFQHKCYPNLAKDAQTQGPSLQVTGLSEGDIEILKEEYQVTTLPQALSKIHEFSLLHNNNPHLISALQNRFEKTLTLGGYSSWTPPKHPKTGELLDSEKALYFARSKQIDLWINAKGEPLTEISTPPSYVVAYYEYEQARSHKLLRKQKIKDVSVFCLQNEIEQKVIFPHLGLTPNDVAAGLFAIITYGSWHAGFPSLQENYQSKQKRKGLPTESTLKTRLIDTQTIWELLHQLYDLTLPQ